MKLTALINFAGCILVVTFGLSVASAEQAACPEPPGGTINCEGGQAAFCRVDKKGRVTGECKTPPKQIAGKPIEVETWTLNQFLDKKVSPSEIENDENLRAILSKRAYRRKDDTLVTFELPTKAPKM
jgi:hypothetical protein